MIGTDSYHIVIEIPNLSDANSIRDYKLSPITLTSIDTSHQDNDENQQNMPSDVIEPLRAKFMGEGIIKLFREFEDDDEDVNFLSSSYAIDSSTPPTSIKNNSNPGDDTMVSIIAVPTYFTATDILGFIGEEYMIFITHIRILKSEKPNRFLVLIKFSDIVKTAEFQFKFNGKLFNSMEPETCHVIFVKSVRFDSNNNEQTVNDLSNSLIPFLLTDPFTSPSVSVPHSPSISKENQDETLIELPTCPVCLERMDSAVTGLLTIPCQHTFHCQCLSKWPDDTCPICRYSNNVSNHKVRKSVRRLLQYNSSRLQREQQQQQQQPRISATGSNSNSSIGLSSTSEADFAVESSERCMDCSSDTNLWICLICGNVGCDRYAPEQHSLKHFVDSGHCFAMELNTSRVWDYAGDNYVHRLVANESDGKIVELPEKSSASSTANGSKVHNVNSATFDKVDEVGFEYSQLLISQLASQREYYESLLNERNAPKSRRGSNFPENNINQKAMTELEIKVEELSAHMSHLTTDIIPSLKMKINNKDEKFRKATNDLNNSNSLNDGLSTKIEFLTKENEELKKSNKDLTEQVNGLMFFLESQEKFKDAPQDVKDGQIVIKENTVNQSKLKKKKK